jgi:hypothetical protein
MREIQQWVVFLLVFLALSACATDKPAPLQQMQATTADSDAIVSPAAKTSDDKRLDVLLTADASRLALGEDSRIDEHTFRLAAAYSHIAKGFWVDERCGFSGQNGRPTRTAFEKDVGAATRVMRRMLESTPGIEESEADRLTQQIQMRALQEMSAKQFFGCGPDAELLYDYAAGEAQYWVQLASK